MRKTPEYIKLPLDKVLAKFGAGGHKPGSGSAAALLGLVSCKFIQTVITLTLSRSQDQDVVETLEQINFNIAESIEPFLFEAFQKDSIQFDTVISARRTRDAHKSDLN